MRSIGCLVLHGFAGDIHEVMPLARHLREQGYAVECPTLDGHGRTRRHLGKSTRDEWVNSAIEAYKRLSMRATEIVVIGFSMGGLLALQVAAKHPVKLLVTMNTPYHYWDVRQALRNLRDDFGTEAARYVQGMVRIPLRSMLQFRQLLDETKSIMPTVTCPCLLLQGERDDTVQAISVGLLRQSIGSDEIDVSYFPESGHLLLKGSEADEAIRVITERIRRL
ncbi:alpha/beta fold hydrolase [Brevibacillus fluminis]|uniref:Alpha/beta fold hydrolase n=1 Tax=Brevibacillus fluminis TaxID=511487 RepID=A0A3M8DCZ0_9BACL|nr:alpha/beta fold hydrolase [Brevibacillus fluminis]RNB85942.1 alpha/beta fold hydrolase [Brevibacillus fluminis]